MSTNNIFLTGLPLLGAGGLLPGSYTTPSINYVFAQNTNYVAFYWTGLEPGKDWLRIESMRRFNGIPTTAIRDVVELIKPRRHFD